MANIIVSSLSPWDQAGGLILEGITGSPWDATSFDEPLPLPPPIPSADEAPSSTQLTLGRRKALSKQLLLALHWLHSRTIAHGDLNPGNFLLAIRRFSTQDVQNIRTSCGNSGKSAEVRRMDDKQDAWGPQYLYLDRPLVGFVDMEREVSAKLSDLGAAFTFDNPPTADKCVTPAALRAPEIVLGSDINHKIDMCSFGCLLYEFLTGNMSFHVSNLTDLPQEENDDGHLLQMIDMLGQPPSEMFTK